MCIRDSVYTGMPDEWKELAEDDTWYLELGKMNVRKALMELEAYEAGIRNTETRNTAAENTGIRNAGTRNAGTWNEFKRFETPGGEIFEKRDDKSFVQRNIKFRCV